MYLFLLVRRPIHHVRLAAPGAVRTDKESDRAGRGGYKRTRLVNPAQDASAETGERTEEEEQARAGGRDGTAALSRSGGGHGGLRRTWRER